MDARVASCILGGLMLVGCVSVPERDYWMLLPFAYHDGRSWRSWYAAGLCGSWRGDDYKLSRWLLPFFFQNDSGVYTLPFSRLWNGPEKTDLYLCGLAGYERTPKEYCSSWVVPFYWHEKDRSFVSSLYGWTGGGTPTTNDWCAAGLIGLRSGAAEGGWIFPLYNHRKDAHDDERSYFFLFDDDRFATFSRRKLGNRLLANYESRRVGYRDEKSWSLLSYLYTGSYWEDRATWQKWIRHRVLWKVLDWRDDDGEVSFDFLFIPLW